MEIEEYRKKLYEIYESRPRPVRTEVNLKTIERQFPVWESRFSRYLPSDHSVPMIDIGCGSGGFVHCGARRENSSVGSVYTSG